MCVNTYLLSYIFKRALPISLLYFSVSDVNYSVFFCVCCPFFFTLKMFLISTYAKYNISKNINR